MLGGGITGALIAYELVRAGMDCMMIDKAEIGGGSTSASTALLSYELDTPLCELAEQVGETEAAGCYRACREAIGKIEHMVEQLGNKSHFTRRKSVYLAEEPLHVPELERECTIRRKHGLAVDFLGRDEIAELFSFRRPAALLTHDAAEIDVVQFVSDLVTAATRMGLRVHGRTEMIEHQRGAGGFTLRMRDGQSVTAGKVVFATGYDSEKYLGRKIGALKSTYAIASHPIAHFSGWHDRALLWTSAHPYLYLRTTSDDRAIIGGEDIDFQDDKLRDSLLPEKAAKLEESFHEFFPEIEFQLACAWAGTFGETSDSLARIGQPREKPGCLFALGYGGNGIAYSMIAAEIVRDACLGLPNPNSRLFRFDR